MPITLDGTNGVTTNSGTLISATTIGVGGATPAASGAGITFPATQSASTDANTLDDYEEGTWTLQIQGGSTAGTTSYSVRSAIYTKIGNVVTITFYVAFSSATGTGAMNITGLPFASGAGIYATGSLMIQSIDWAGGTMSTLYKPPSNAVLEIYASGDNIGWLQQQMDANGEIMGTMTYFVA